MGVNQSQVEASGTVPDANGTTKGIAKLYNNVDDSNTDGAPDQASVNLALVELDIEIGAHVLDTGNPHNVTKTQVGLPNVDNTSDANKPVSTAQQTAIDAKVIDSIADSDTTHAPSRNAVFDALALKATIASPTFTGTPAAPTPSANDNSTKIATTAYTDAKVADSITDGVTAIAPSQNAVFDALAANNIDWEETFYNDSASTGTRYYGIKFSADMNVEANLQLRVKRAFTLSNFFVTINTIQPANPSVFTVRKNGADTSVTVTVAAAAASLTEMQDNTNTVAFAVNDTISIKVVTATTASATIAYMGFKKTY